MKQLKIIFMGTPQFSVNVLQGLIDNYQVVAVVTQPDRKVGRKKVITFSPVKELAIKHNIPVYQPEKIRTNYQDILEIKADIIITCAYGQIIPTPLLEAFPYKPINVHASLLPKLRGGAPIHKAIMNGDTKTGITIMYMVDKMDAGDILYQREIPITNLDTASSLHEKLSELGCDLLLDSLPKIINNEVNPIAQNEAEVTYGYNVTRDEELVDFTRSSQQIYNQIRGLNSFPGAYAKFEGNTLKIWNSKIGESQSSLTPGTIINIYNDGIGVTTGDGEIIILEIQVAGSKKMLVKNYLNGLKDKESLIGKQFN